MCVTRMGSFGVVVSLIVSFLGGIQVAGAAQLFDLDAVYLKEYKGLDP